MAKKKNNQKTSVKKSLSKTKPKQRNSLKKQNETKLFAFIASFFTIIGFVVAIILKKQDKYVMFYAKQGLTIFLFQLLVSIFNTISIKGWQILENILWIFLIILWAITWINSLSGIKRKTFIIGDIAEKIKI